MHEASNQQETSTNTSVESKSIPKEKCENVGELTHVGTHNNTRESVDIIFEDITYTVNLGCKKGELSQALKFIS